MRPRRKLRNRVPTRSTAALRLLALLGPVVAGGGCNGAVVTMSPQRQHELKRRATDLLLRAAQSEDPFVCSNAIEALVEVAPDDGLPRFRAALVSPSPLIRFAGLVALGSVRDRHSQLAVRQLQSDPHALVRLAAAFAACRRGDTAQAPVLVDALNEHPTEQVRAEAARLIGLLEEPRAVKRLRAALGVRANERSSIVRTQIYTALARLGDEQARQRLIEHSQYDALSRLLALQGLIELRLEATRDALLYHLNDDENYLVHRLIAARGLAQLGSDAGYRLARENINYAGRNPDDPDEAMRVRVNAALVLGALRDRRALGVLKAMAETEDDPRLQVAAAYAICRIVGR